MTIDFFVEGKPQGKARPRFSNGHTYTPQKTKNYEELVKMSFLKEYRNRNRFKMQNLPLFGDDKALSVVILAYYPIPSKWSKILKNKAIADEVKPTIKPDVDNIVKVILDALNGLAYADDKQVVSCRVSKCYDDELTGVSVMINDDYRCF